MYYWGMLHKQKTLLQRSLLRTDANFRNGVYSDDYHTGITPLLSLDLDLVQNIPLDYMHLVCLGLVKRLIRFWYRGNISIRLNAEDLGLVNSALLEFRNSISSKDFCRLPRPIIEFDRWKATEFRQFLLYSGPFILKDKLKPSQYCIAFFMFALCYKNFNHSAPLLELQWIC